MKRIGLVCLGLALGLASTAHAQLTMQMSNGWSFTFAGNVNGFIYYEKSQASGSTVGAFGGLVPAGNVVSATRITTGLLPAFAVFDAKGKEGNTDLGVHFGFAPQINCAQGVHDCFGAQIDMRQVYLTFGGSWGQVLVGRELGLFSRQNILTDQTLFGVGASGNGAPGSGQGTTLGRIGFGYIYPQFKAQIAYSTPAGKPSQLSVGIYEAASLNNAPSTAPVGTAAPGPYLYTPYPRVEAEFTYSVSPVKVWVGGLAQNVKSAPSGPSVNVTSWGGDAGIRYEQSTFSLTGSGYYGEGLGTTLLGLGAVCSPACGTNGNNDRRKSYGYIGQLTFTPTGSKATIAGSFGSSWLKASQTEGGTAKTENTLISGGIYYQSTKSLKIVGEFDYMWTKDHPSTGTKNVQWSPVVGVMLFF